MKTLILSIGFTALFLGSALAQAPAQQKWIPPQVSEQDARQLRTWLDDQPTKFGLPVLQWLQNLEDRTIAKIKKDEEDAKAAAERNKQIEDNEKANQK